MKEFSPDNHETLKKDQPKKIPDGATMVDVAKEAGVSTATVSRVINGKTNVIPETREIVLKAMDSLDYAVNYQARSLRRGKSHIIGVVVHDLGTEYIGAILRGIDQEISKSSYEMLLYTTHKDKSEERVRVNSLIRGLADGLILILPLMPKSYLKSFSQRHFPYVLVDYEGKENDDHAVGTTNRSGAYEAISYLISLGHRRIGFIRGDLEIASALQRLDGYKAALADHNIAVDPALIFNGTFKQSSGFLGANGFLDLAEPPTAIFASNDLSAFGVMEAIRVRGLRIPEDISVVGFDNIPQSAFVHPPLTTVKQPLEEMGSQATRLILQYLNEQSVIPNRVDLPTELILRESCAKPRFLV